MKRRDGERHCVRWTDNGRCGGRPASARERARASAVDEDGGCPGNPADENKRQQARPGRDRGRAGSPHNAQCEPTVQATPPRDAGQKSKRTDRSTFTGRADPNPAPGYLADQNHPGTHKRKDTEPASRKPNARGSARVIPAHAG